MLNIGERLKEERVRLGYNQADFAAVAGVAKTSQFNYEKGERSPDAEYLAAAAAIGLDVLYVVTGVRTPLPVEGFSADEVALVAQYRQLSPGDQFGAAKMVTALAKMASQN